MRPCLKKSTAILVLAGILLGGCSKQESGVTMEFWTLQLSPTFDQYFAGLIKNYEAVHPGIRIRWVDIPYDVAIQKLLASVAAGNAPDLVNLSSDFLAKFSSMDVLADFKTLLPRDSLNLFFPNALSTCTYGEKVIALPWYLDTYVLIYNKKFLSAAGMTAKDIPRTFSELATFVRRCKDLSGMFALFWNIGKDTYMPIMLESEGVSMTDSLLRRATFANERGIALVSQWVDLYRGGYLPRESIIRSGSSVIEAYQSGQVAMVFTGPVFLERVRVNAPAIYEQTDVAPTPVGETGKQELATMVVSVLATSRYKKEAADFAMFLLNAPNQIAFSRITTTYPSVVSALSDPFFTTDDGTVEGKARVVGAQELPHAFTLARYTRHPDYVRLREILGEAIQNACLGRLSTREALSNAAQQWNEILAQGRR